MTTAKAEGIPNDAKVGQGQRKDRLWTWFVVEFLNSYAVTLVTAGFYDYATSDHVKATPSARLWMSASWGFAYIFISLMAGRLSEKLGPRKSALTAISTSAITAATGLAALWVPQVWVLVVLMLFYNITSTLIWPAIESGLTRSQGRMPLSARIGLFNLSWGLANFTGFFTRGVWESIGWETIFIVPAIVTALSAAFLWIWGVPSSRISKEHVPDDAEGEHELDAPGMRARAAVLVKMAWMGNALAYVAINVWIPLLTRLGIMAGIPKENEALVGYVTAVWGFARFIGFGIAWRWRGWHYNANLLVGAQVALAISFCGMLTIHNLAVLIPLQIVFGLCIALMFSSSLYYAMHVSSGHGGHAAIHEALVGLGVAIGPTIGALAGTGELGEEAMMRIGFAVTGVLLVGTGMMYWMSRKARLPR